MAFNPFLSMSEPQETAPATSEVLNPFMMAVDEESLESEMLVGENPFATSNPFAEWGGAPEPASADPAPPPPLDIFGGAELFSPPERIAKPTELDLVHPIEDTLGRRPPPPARPLPPETQTLIQSVTGQMDFTSSHLLDRIPLTRTPSPVSVRDIQSPSPTPEPEPELLEQTPAENLDINRNKPVRPPPARPAPPPPRPAPPPPPPKQTHNHEDINLFDAPPTTVYVKPTNEDILSLYSKTNKEVKPVDFLSDDLPSTLDSDNGSAVTSEGALDSIPEQKVLSSAPADPTPFQPVDDDLPMGYLDSTMVNDSAPFHELSENKALAETEYKNPFEITSDFSSGMHETGNAFLNEKTDTFTSQNIFDTAQSMNFETKNDTSTYEVMQVEEPTTGTIQVDESAAWPVESEAASWPAAAPEAASWPTAASAATPAWPAAAPEAPPAWPAAAPEASPAWPAAAAEDPPAWPAAAPEASPGWPAAVPEAPPAWPAAAPEAPPAWPAAASEPTPGFVARNDDTFDAFSAKFDSTASNHTTKDAWGGDAVVEESAAGFEAEAFDPFLSMGPPPPSATPRLEREGSRDSADDNFTLVIRPKDSSIGNEAQAVPVLAPPPRPHALPESPRANPFDRTVAPEVGFTESSQPESHGDGGEDDSGPPTPLFDDDVSMPLEDFPRTKYIGPGWEMQLRQPNKKKITGQRFWKKVWVRLAIAGEAPVLQLLKTATDKEPFQELPLQACYSVSDIAAQQFDQFGKIFTVKLQYVFYKERPGVRPGQVTKAERITNKLSQFAAYAIQGDYQGVKEFGSDLRKLGLPVEHAPQVSQLFKLGSLCFEDVKQFSCCVEESLFRLVAHRDRALTYKLEEVQITVVDELYVEQDAEGSIHKQIARVRLFFLGFLSGMPDVELGVNDMRRQGREVVGRHDIIPVVTEEWIRVEDTEFHACVQPEEFTKTQIIKFKPPDACYIELMRFRVRPPKNRELPLQLKAVWCVNGTRVELRADVLVPGFASRKLGQIPCEDVSIRFPIPECWIYLFRVEKHFRYGSVKSAHRRTGKIKGIERFLGAVDTLQESLIEVTSGQAKYEHQHRAIVWRMPRLPKEGQGAYTTHNMVCRMALTSFDQIPAELARHATVEFTMPATQVSHTTVRSVSLQEHDGDPPEKYVRYLARHEYIVGIERTSGQEAPAYASAARVTTAPAPATPAPALAPVPAAPSSDSDSD